MTTLHQILKDVEESRWLNDPSPIGGKFNYGHCKICIITGPNIAGKSLLRKVIGAHHQKANIEYVHLSQAGRCQSGIGRAFIYGSEEDDSTGCNSMTTLLTAIKTGQNRTKPFSLFFDEPEIGCSEELTAALAIRLIRDFETMPNLVGLMIVSHSRQFIKRFLALNPTHIHLSNDETTLEQWVNRDIIPIESLEDLKETARQRWNQLNKMMNEKDSK